MTAAGCPPTAAWSGPAGHRSGPILRFLNPAFRTAATASCTWAKVWMRPMALKQAVIRRLNAQRYPVEARPTQRTQGLDVTGGVRVGLQRDLGVAGHRAALAEGPQQLCQAVRSQIAGVPPPKYTVSTDGQQCGARPPRYGAAGRRYTRPSSPRCGAESKKSQ